MREIDSNPKYKLAAEATGLFGCYLRNRLRAALEEGCPDDIQAMALHAADYGSPDLADEAAVFLNQHFQARAGEEEQAEAFVGPIKWSTEEEPGRGVLLWNGREWTMLDYRDKLALEEGFPTSWLAALLPGTIHELSCGNAWSLQSPPGC